MITEIINIFKKLFENLLIPVLLSSLLSIPQQEYACYNTVSYSIIWIYLLTIILKITLLKK